MRRPDHVHPPNSAAEEARPDWTSGRKRARGFTLLELLTVIAIIAAVMGLLLPAMNKARAAARLVKDATQIAQIHRGWILFSGAYNDRYPTPGLIDTLGDIPGYGDEDVQLNETAALYSACIAQNYFGPSLVVSPSETSGRVMVKDDYDWDGYLPSTDNWWDGSFRADLEVLSNTSYAHSTMAGVRKREQWRNTFDSSFVVIGNRGVRNGSLDSNEYNSSLTLGIHGGGRQWSGNICFNDNHILYTKTFTPDPVTFTAKGATFPDNLFAEQTTDRRDDEKVIGEGSGYDVWLTISTAISEDEVPQLSWD